MFSLFRKKSRTIDLDLRPFSDEIIEVSASTVRICHKQIGDWLGREPQSMPNLGPMHDWMVGSYVCGFMQGQFIAAP